MSRFISSLTLLVLLIITSIVISSTLIINKSYANNLESYQELLPSGSHLNFISQKVGDKTPLAAYQEDQFSAPASTMKVLTALAAQLELGKDFKFTTTFERTGSIKKGVLNGDLIVRFSSDPTFTQQHLQKMVTKLKQAGVSRIAGNLIIEAGHFASHDSGPGRVWNDLTQCFSAPPSGAIIDGNCINMTLAPASKVGMLAKPILNSEFPVRITSRVLTIPADDDKYEYCELDVTATPANEYTLTGCIPIIRNPKLLRFAVQNGMYYAARMTQKQLAGTNIILSGKVKYSAQGKKGRVVTKHESAKLPVLLKHMLKYSDNLIADSLFKTLGYKLYGIGTWRSGSDALRQILDKRADLDLYNAVIADGSGLSRYNAISPDIMINALQYIAKHDRKLEMMAMFPIAGSEGTLFKRHSFKDEVIFKDNLTAKTGSLEGIYNLAGFLTTEKGTKLAFVQFVSGYSSKAKKSEEQPVYQMENQLYKALYDTY